VPPAETLLPGEVEWQFDALDLRPVERFIARVQGLHSPARPGLELAARPAKRLADCYLDSADWRIGRAGRVLRVRHSGRSFVATLKDLVDSKDGLRSRIEIEEPLAAGALPATGDGPVTSRVRALAGSARLLPVLEVRTRRRPFILSRAGVELGELVLDETAITAPTLRRPLRLRRVELEVLGAATSELEPFVVALREECGLQPAALSKFEAGLLAAGLEIPTPAELPAIAVTPESTLGELAFAALRADTNEVLRREPGTRLGEDPEELHRMRVATRRLRAALKLFAEALPVRAAHLEEEIGWLAAELGVVRDLDVQLEQLAEWSAEAAPADEEGLAELAAALEEARLGARTGLLRSLDSRRYQRLVAGLRQMLAAAPPRRSARARTACAVGLPELLGGRQLAARKAARRARKSGAAEDFHRLRIRVKRLRYALEFSARSYGSLPKRYTRELVGLQDELGAMQDAVTAAERLREAALSGTGALSLGAVFAIGGLAERYRHEAERLRALVGEEARAVDGGHWKRLATALERRRNDALAAIEAAHPAPRPRAPRRPAPLARLALLPPSAELPPEAGQGGVPLPS